MTNLRIGIIGLGMGRHHITGYRSHPQADVVAIADPDRARLQEIGDRYGIARRYEFAEAMLQAEQLDVVSVATPNSLHAPLTIAALEAGCHVLCEKPMATSAAEAARMLEAAKRTGRRIGINFSYRFTEASMALKREVDTGVLGDVYFARTIWHRRRGFPGFGSWFGLKALSGGGPLIDLGVHRLDLALWLMGYPRPVWVLGAAYDHIATALAAQQGVEYDCEDLAVALIRFENGATVEVEASWGAHIKEQELMETRLLGTRGGLVQRNVEETYKFEAEMYVERDGSQFDIKLHPGPQPVMSAMYHFVDAIVRGVPHTATGEEGLRIMHILDAIYQSAEEGQPIRIQAERAP